MIVINLTRDPARHGESDEWTAKVAGQPSDYLRGVGPTSDAALGCLLRVNLRTFGVARVVVCNPQNPG
jgi:hypothetical protein